MASLHLRLQGLVQWLFWSHGFALGFAAMRLYFCENLVTSFGICR